MFDDFADTGQDYVDNDLQMALDKHFPPETDATANAEVLSDSDSDSSDCGSEDSDKSMICTSLDLRDLTKAIDNKARNASVYQQAALQIADQCRVLVNAYTLWEETFSAPEKAASLPIQTQVMYQIAFWISEMTLDSDLNRVLEFLQSFGVSPELFNEDPKRVSQAFSNALNFLCCHRFFISLTDGALSDTRASMEEAICCDQAELNCSSLYPGRDAVRTGASDLDPQTSLGVYSSRISSLGEASHPADIAASGSQHSMNKPEVPQPSLSCAQERVKSLAGSSRNEKLPESPGNETLNSRLAQVVADERVGGLKPTATQIRGILKAQDNRKIDSELLFGDQVARLGLDPQIQRTCAHLDENTGKPTFPPKNRRYQLKDLIKDLGHL